MADQTGTVVMGLVGGLLVIIIGLALLPVVTAFADIASANASATTAPLIDLIPLFWVIAIVALTVGVVFLGFRSARMR